MAGPRAHTAASCEPCNPAHENDQAVEHDALNQAMPRVHDASESSSLNSSSMDSAKSSVTKPLTFKPASVSDLYDGPPTLRHALQHMYSSAASRASSARTSSSSLQALNEDTIVDAQSGSNSLRQDISHHAQPDRSSTDYPVYPDQSYAVLQSQVHHNYRSLHRSRSAYPGQADTIRSSPPPRDSRTAGNTPVSSPGLFSVSSSRSAPPFASDDEEHIGSLYLHPTHLQPPKETHTAEVDRDLVTGNKLINQYEILEELGRGEHGKVKLGRHVTTKQQVAIKIVQRYSKRRRLGKLGNPEDKVKREVAILKKARHPNVVSLLEVIDDPNRQKVYIVLEYVENGEIVWRRKGVREIVQVDKRRLEREKLGIPDSPSFIEESQQYMKVTQRRRHERERARERSKAQAAALQQHPIRAWSLEHGGESDDELGPEMSIAPTSSRNEEGRLSPSHSFLSTSDPDRRGHEAVMAAVEGSMYGPYVDFDYEKRRFSTASSSLGFAPSESEWTSDDDDLSYVPCLTMIEARNAFRDSLLGLEYLHYQGIIHRDIKPANLLVTANHRVKISDFGVSYLGRPIRDEDEEQVTETDATELDDARELSKTVGTPAFYAPELCYTGDDFVKAIGSVPKITGAIDIWSLGVTLYGMIFGRLPFVSDEEYSMFQTIVKNDVFIPRKRLRPVEGDPNTTTSQWPRTINSNKRMDDELAYEDIGDDLYDLLKRLLTKDPLKRIMLKEIKHHPWVLHGLPNPSQWIEETDPGYQSKGKKIEVSNEEVTTAVSKVPFIQRVRSNVAKWSGYLTGRTKDKIVRKRASSSANSVDSEHSSVSSKDTLGKFSGEGRRGSLRGDEDVFRTPKAMRDVEHPLAKSVSASPVGDAQSPSRQESRREPSPPRGRMLRPEPPQRAASALSTAESTKTVRPPDFGATQPRATTPTFVEPFGTSHIGGFFGGASRRLSRGLQTGHWRSERSRSIDTAALDGDGHSEPSLALSSASAVGHMQTSDLWSEEDPVSAHAGSDQPGHQRNSSHQLPCQSSAESFQLTKEALLRQRQPTHDTNADGDGVTFRDEVESRSCDHSRQQMPLQLKDSECPVSNTDYDPPRSGLTTSPPSAATISSSSADDYTSSMSPSASHPSIPSVISSVSGDGFGPHAAECEQEISPTDQVPRILRTGETVKANSQEQVDDDESRYYCDDEDDEDEGIIIMGKMKQTPHKRQASNV